MPSEPAAGRAAGAACDDVPRHGAGLHFQAEIGDAGVGLLFELDAESLGGRLEERLALRILIGSAERHDGEFLRHAACARHAIAVWRRGLPSDTSCFEAHRAPLGRSAVHGTRPLDYRIWMWSPARAILESGSYHFSSIRAIDCTLIGERFEPVGIDLDAPARLAGNGHLSVVDVVGRSRGKTFLPWIVVRPLDRELEVLAGVRDRAEQMHGEQGHHREVGAVRRAGQAGAVPPCAATRSVRVRPPR